MTYCDLSYHCDINDEIRSYMNTSNNYISIFLICRKKKRTSVLDIIIYIFHKLQFRAPYLFVKDIIALYVMLSERITKKESNKMTDENMHWWMIIDLIKIMILARFCYTMSE